MCMFCAAIPATAAIGAKLNAEQLHKPEEQRKPIAKIISVLIGFLLIASITYHTLRWQN